MCGIAGLWDTRFAGFAEIDNLARQMSAAISHRGPDGHGQWIDASLGLGLAHRRLSIVELSSAGAQPMLSACGRYVLIFNGEIYNHLELRGRLSVQRWRGNSDTETLLEAFAAWGVSKALERTIGMFALALWDRQRRELTLARDRMGEKPLYYGWQGNSFLFGSELKALQSHPDFAGDIDRDALCLQLRYGYIPAPLSIYRGIHKLFPGHIFQLTLDERQRRELPPSRPYWSLSDSVEAANADAFNGGPDEAVDALDALLRDAVGRQMMADVPLGAFLSGGIDSSTIVAIMQSQSDRPVKTFTIGFEEAAYNEAAHARAVAKHLGTEHTELYVAPQQALEVIPKLPALYDEPFSDSSQIPTFLVSQLAQQHVTVSLSGDGGDELFGGYARYFQAHRAWSTFGWLPPAIRSKIGGGLNAISVDTWNSLTAFLQPAFPTRHSNLGDKIHKFADLLNEQDISDFYRRLISHWAQPSEVVRGGAEPSELFQWLESVRVRRGSIEAMMHADSLSYLPDDILTKVDRAAMATSLETRVPMLDHRVVEFAWRLPRAYKVRAGKGKWILRQVLERYIPHRLIDRPKMGFAVPIDEWLRGPLRDWAESLLDPARLEREGFFSVEPIRKKWDEHLSGRRNWQYHLWDVLMFQAWHEQAGSISSHTDLGT